MLCWHRSSVNIFLFVLNTNCLSLSCSFNTILSKSLPRNNHHIVAQRAKETSQSLIKQTVMMMWKCYTKSYSTYNMFINDFWCYFFSVLLLFFFCCCWCFVSKAFTTPFRWMGALEACICTTQNDITENVKAKYKRNKNCSTDTKNKI